MPVAKLSEADFVEMFEKYGPAEMVRRTGVPEAAIARRRRRLEVKLRRPITGPDHPNRPVPAVAHPHRAILEVRNGVVIVGSDAHYWPGEPSTAHRAFVRFVKDLKPRAVIMNGDAFDGARISRHPPIGWAETPTVIQELGVVQDRLHEIVSACPRGCRKIWTLGNHDARFESRIAVVAPEFAKVKGVSLKDHFPIWEPCWSVFINDDVVVKHRFKGGMHAPQNGTLWAGRTVVTGHLHSAKVQPITDYNGTRFGVDTGCLADVDGPQFDYAEDNPRSWRSGFCVLTFKDGRLLWPELVTVWGPGQVQFRGEVFSV